MREFSAGSYDVAVIGAGHAGIEASLACARLGMKTVCFTINLDAVGNMPCNPAIGGTGKGHLVRELDALGGEIGNGSLTEGGKASGNEGLTVINVMDFQREFDRALASTRGRRVLINILGEEGIAS